MPKTSSLNTKQPNQYKYDFILKSAFELTISELWLSDKPWQTGFVMETLTDFLPSQHYCYLLHCTLNTYHLINTQHVKSDKTFTESSRQGAEHDKQAPVSDPSVSETDK